MMPQQMPPEQGGDIYGEIGMLLEQMVQMAGPEAVLQFLQQAMGGQPQQPAPEVMSRGGPQSMPSQRPGVSRLPKGRQRLAQ